MMIIFYLTNVKKYCVAWDKKTIVQKVFILRDILATFVLQRKINVFQAMIHMQANVYSTIRGRVTIPI
jgi:hypothetical protein